MTSRPIATASANKDASAVKREVQPRLHEIGVETGSCTAGCAAIPSRCRPSSRARFDSDSQ